MGRKARYYYSLQELQEKALEAWRNHAEEYRSLIPKYQELLSKKRWLRKNERGYGSMPLNRLNQSLLNEFIQIPFFDAKTEEEALDFLYDLELSDLNRLLATIYAALDDRAYKSIKARIEDFEYQIKYWKRSKYIAYDPTFPLSPGHRPKARNSGRRSSGIDD